MCPFGYIFQSFESVLGILWKNAKNVKSSENSARESWKFISDSQGQHVKYLINVLLTFIILSLLQ